MLSWDLWGVWLATPGWNLFLYLFFLFPFSLSSISFKYVVFFYWRDRYRDICKQRCLGTSWMGWGPIDLVGRVLPEAKFREKMHLFLFFGFERLIPRYLLKTVLNPIIWLRAGRTWAVGSVPKWPVYGRARPSRRAFGENSPSKARIFVILPVYMWFWAHSEGIHHWEPAWELLLTFRWSFERLNISIHLISWCPPWPA